MHRRGGGARPVRSGILDAVGVPGLTLGASFVGLGVLAHSHGLSLAEAVASTVLAFSISGQTAYIHATASGAPLLPLALAVLAANVRLLPLAGGVVARIRRRDGPPPWFNLAVALLVAATAWASVARRADEMPKEALAVYALAAGLAFLAAAYFGILMAAEAAKGGGRTLAVASGAVLTPALAADLGGGWALVAAGLVGALAAAAEGEWAAWRVRGAAVPQKA
jgi:predicted branched-subunit amino acid permease